MKNITKAHPNEERESAPTIFSATQKIPSTDKEDVNVQREESKNHPPLTRGVPPPTDEPKKRGRPPGTGNKEKEGYVKATTSLLRIIFLLNRFEKQQKEKQKMIIPEQRWRTSFHEAAHATCLIRLFGRLDYVTIRGDDQCYGHTRTLAEDWNYIAPTEDGQIAHTAKLCTMLLCGAAAVLKLLGEIEQGHVHFDLGDTHDLLQTVVEEQDKEMQAFKRIWRHAQDVVREEWEAIFAVAKELMERETLTGEEVLRIIKEQKERVE